MKCLCLFLNKHLNFYNYFHPSPVETRDLENYNLNLVSLKDEFMTTQNKPTMRKLKWIKPAAVAFGFCALLTACDSGNSNNNVPPTQPNVDSLERAKMEEIQKIFFSIPAPMEMASLLKENGYKYDAAVLNSTSNVTNYTSEEKRAVNLGIYGADLSYASMFDQKQESMNYLAAAQKLAREMGVDGALQSDIIERLNSNQDNRDSIIHIVSEAYSDLNGYLKENDRIEVSALVVAGGWMEALYLSTRYTGSGNAELRTRIAEQKYSLDELIKYFGKFGENAKLAGVKADLVRLQEVYAEVEITKGATQSSKGSDGTFTIGNASTTSMSDETLKKIETLISEIRSKYIA